MAENQTKAKRKILVVDDSETNLALLRVHLNHLGLEPILTQSPHAAIELALKESPSIALLDIMMPEMDGFELCRRLKQDQRTRSIPVIFLSARDESHDKVAGLKLGAIDYITKPFDAAELKARLDIILQMTELQEKLVSQANTDELTGLANRRSFLDALDREVLQAKVNNTHLAVVMIDLDHFKSINDNYGHLGGDIILKQMAQIIRRTVYTLDIPARYGGEEFIVIMPGINQEKAANAAEKLRSAIESAHWKVSVDNLRITASFGVTAMHADNPVDGYDLTKQADAALYSAKNRGRNCVVTWDQVNPDEEMEIQESQDIRDLQGKINFLANQLKNQALGSISALSEAMVAKDPFIADHARHVQIYAESLARRIPVSSVMISQINNAALLHDLGKISIPNPILRKKSPLTEREKKIIQQHPLISVKIVSPIGIFHDELQIIKHHHERFDGKGYPDGLRNKQIPFGARILAIADSYDAMTSDRQYRQALSGPEALAEIKRLAGVQFDPELAGLFLKLAEEKSTEWPLKEKTSPVLEKL